MRFYRNILIFLMIGLFPSSIAWASVRHENFSGGAVNIYVAVGHTTEIIFPEPVAELIRSQAKDSFSHEVNDSSLFILPKLEVGGDLFIRTKNGKSYPINLIFRDTPDLQVIIDDLQQETLKKNKNLTNGNYSIELIKNLLKEGDIPEATKEELNTEFFSNGLLKMTLIKKYELNNAIALVAEIENEIDRSVITPIQHISLKNLKAISSDSDMLKPKGEEGSKTKIYMVIGK